MRVPLTVTVSALSLALALPLAAQQQPPGTSDTTPRYGGEQSWQPSSRGTTASRQMPFTRVAVASASQIIGQPVRSPDNDRVGEVENLLINPRNGQVVFAVIGRGGFLDLGDELFAVPFGHLVARRNSANQIYELETQLGTAQLASAPRIRWNEIERLTQPSYQTAVFGHFAPADADTGSEGASAATGRAGGETGRSNESSADRQGNTTSFDERRPDKGALEPDEQFMGAPGRERTAERMRDPQLQRRQDTGEGLSERTRDPAPREQQGERQRSDRQGASENLRTSILVGRTYLTVLVPPSYGLPSEMRGANVVFPDGGEAGEISSLIIDLDRGRVAYAVVAQGGFLGLGETLKPVPFKALDWVSNERFELPIGAARFDRVRRLTSEGTPTQIRRRDLEQLFESYGTRPYWDS